MINIRQFRHFVAVLENGSLLGAARHLNISQPALSKSIATLEVYYKVSLFKRLPRGVQPTIFALTLEPHARRMLRDVFESHAEIDAVASGSSGTISVGAGSTFIRLVGETISEFESKFSDVQFRVTTDHSKHLRRALLDNSIDCFVGMANEEIDDPAFDVELIYLDNFVGICASDHPFAGLVISPASLAECNWIMPEPEEPARRALEAYLMVHAHCRPKVKITTNADQVLRQSLIGTNYVSLTPQMNVLMPDFRDFGTFKIDRFDFQRKVGIVQRANVVAPPLRERFLKLLSARIGKLAADPQA